MLSSTRHAQFHALMCLLLPCMFSTRSDAHNKPTTVNGSAGKLVLHRYVGQIINDYC